MVGGRFVLSVQQEKSVEKECGRAGPVVVWVVF